MLVCQASLSILLFCSSLFVTVDVISLDDTKSSVLTKETSAEIIIDFNSSNPFTQDVITKFDANTNGAKLSSVANKLLPSADNSDVFKSTTNSLYHTSSLVSNLLDTRSIGQSSDAIDVTLTTAVYSTVLSDLTTSLDNKLSFTTITTSTTTIPTLDSGKNDNTLIMELSSVTTNKLSTVESTTQDKQNHIDAKTTLKLPLNTEMPKILLTTTAKMSELKTTSKFQMSKFSILTDKTKHFIGTDFDTSIKKLSTTKESEKKTNVKTKVGMLSSTVDVTQSTHKSFIVLTFSDTMSKVSLTPNNYKNHDDTFYNLNIDAKGNALSLTTLYVVIIFASLAFLVVSIVIFMLVLPVIKQRKLKRRLHLQENCSTVDDVVRLNRIYINSDAGWHLPSTIGRSQTSTTDTKRLWC